MSAPAQGLRRVIRPAALLRLGLSGALLGWLALGVDWGALLESLRTISPLMLLLTCLLYYLGLALSCLKWQLILRAEGIAVGLPRLIGWYLLGAFASNFLPTDVGGDVGRGYLAARHTGRALAVTRSILVERLSGLVFMLLLAWAGAVVLLPAGRWFLLAAPLALLAALAGWALWRNAPRHPAVAAALAWAHGRLPARLRSALAGGLGEGRVYLGQPGTLAGILALSLGFQLLAGLGLWLNLAAVGVSLPLAPVILTMALASVASLLPVTMNGWGVREGVMIALLVPFGAPASGVLAAALLARGLVLLLSLPGALPLLAGRRAAAATLTGPVTPTDYDTPAPGPSLRMPSAAAAQSARYPMKKLLKHALRLTITAAMLAWIITRVDLGSVGTVLAQTNPAWIAAGVAIYLLSIVCSAWRWQRILAGLGFGHHLLHILRLVLAGAFFNMFLPSSVGGDLMKMVLIAPDVSRREVAISSVLMDRVIGLAVTIAVGLVAVLLLPVVWDEPAVLATLALAVVVFCAGMVTIFNRGLIDLAGRVVPGFIWGRVGQLVLRVHESLMLIGRSRGVLAQAAAISVLRQFAICLSVFCAGQAFGLGLPPVAYFATVPLAVAITALPVAINGLGLQDNALIFLLATVGVSAAEALSLSIFLHALRNGTGLLGGLIFALTGRGAEASRQPSAAVERAIEPSRAAE